MPRRACRPLRKTPQELSHKYLGIDLPAEKEDEVRVIVRITPSKMIKFSA
ncbi:hypothetical protein [Streptomyces longwoodensis]